MTIKFMCQALMNCDRGKKVVLCRNGKWWEKARVH
jgi:hypothetical protein